MAFDQSWLRGLGFGAEHDVASKEGLRCALDKFEKRGAARLPYAAIAGRQLEKSKELRVGLSCSSSKALRSLCSSLHRQVALVEARLLQGLLANPCRQCQRRLCLGLGLAGLPACQTFSFKRALLV